MSDLTESKTHASQDFFDWLQQCPIHWTRDGDNDHYEFYEIQEESND